MTKEKRRVTRQEAADLAGVSVRTISRWRARGLLEVERDPSFRKPATYDGEEVLRVAALMRRTAEDQGETDNSPS